MGNEDHICPSYVTQSRIRMPFSPFCCCSSLIILFRILPYLARVSPLFLLFLDTNPTKRKSELLFFFDTTIEYCVVFKVCQSHCVHVNGVTFFSPGIIYYATNCIPTTRGSCCLVILRRQLLVIFKTSLVVCWHSNVDSIECCPISYQRVHESVEKQSKNCVVTCSAPTCNN